MTEPQLKTARPTEADVWRELDEHDRRIRKIELWQAMVLGAASAIGFLVGLGVSLVGIVERLFK